MARSVPTLRILHVFRSPLGGLFRHVADMVRGQMARGHEMGMVCEDTRRGDEPERILAELKPRLALGLQRIPMSRKPGWSDIAATRYVARCIAQARPQVVHGHGAKGGAYARIAANARMLRVYTPHGGSIHYAPNTPQGFFYQQFERFLLSRTDLLLFESAYAQSLYRARIGTAHALARVVYNGLAASEFVDVVHEVDATDLLFIGELREIKGIDVLLRSLAQLRQSGLALTATVVGDGPSGAQLRALAQTLGLGEIVRFPGAMPARRAFACGRLVVVPSRAESLPYIVLETAAAGLPLIATAVGGIPEIFGPQAHLLIPPGDVEALCAALRRAVNQPETLRAEAGLLRQRVRAVFSIDTMVESALDAYVDALEAAKTR